MTLHGGSAEITSRLGHGTRVTLRMPALEIG
jgi:signal transduction histidine kinase